MTVWREPIQFQWDAGNREKNQVKHGVTNGECEEVFFDPRKRILRSALHEGSEARHLMIGETLAQRRLFVVFTVRGDAVRVISARSVNRDERGLYEK